MLKFAHLAIALTLLLPTLEASAGIAPHASFSRGFSSHASASHVTAAPARAPSGGFGAFSSRSPAAAPSAPAPARSPSGSFGAFGNAQAPTQKSDSALSQQLSKNASEARALQTLDQRNAAKAAQNAPQPAPGYAQSAPAQQSGAPIPAPAAPPTVIVNQNGGGGGLGHVIAGAMIARSMNAHAHSGYYPAPGTGYNGAGGQAPASHGTSLFSLFLTLCLLAVIAWGLWFAWKGVQRRRAALAQANQPNYSFKRD